MKYTENLNLKKPEKSDYINVEDFNDNADIIDKELKDLDNNKVEKEEGKGLTKNEFTDTDKDKLDGIEEKANKTEIVDSLNSNDINKALSAKQGKRLEDKKADKNYVDEQVENIEVPVTSVNDKTGDVNLSKSDIGLDNVDNVKQASKEEFDEFKAKAENDLEGLSGDLESHILDYEHLKDSLDNVKANDIQARREIMDIKMRLDEKSILDFLNKTGIGFFDFFDTTEWVDTSNTTADVDTSKQEVRFNGDKVLSMLEQKFDGEFSNVELAIYDKDREYFEVDNNVEDDTEIEMMLSPGSREAGERFYYDGEVYTITSVEEL